MKAVPRKQTDPFKVMQRHLAIRFTAVTSAVLLGIFLGVYALMLSAQTVQTELLFSRLINGISVPLEESEAIVRTINGSFFAKIDYDNYPDIAFRFSKYLPAQEEQIITKLRSLLSADNDQGRLIIDEKAYRYRVLRDENNQNEIRNFVFLDQTRELQTMTTLAAVLAIAFIIGSSALYVICLKLAAQAVQPLKTAYNRQRDFLADASHALRTPAAVIGANADVAHMLAAQSHDPADLIPWINAIQKESGYLSQMVRSMLALVRLDVAAEVNDRSIGGQDREKESLHSTILNLVDAFDPLAAADGHMLTFIRKINRDVQVDGTDLRTVLSEILENALKYSPSGKPITLTIDTSETKGNIQVHIDDHGPGIPIALRETVFERYFRADATRKAHKEGIGLGLSIAKAICERNGWHIYAANAPDSGARFTIEIPFGPFV